MSFSVFSYQANRHRANRGVRRFVRHLAQMVEGHYSDEIEINDIMMKLFPFWFDISYNLLYEIQYSDGFPTQMFSNTCINDSLISLTLL